MKRSQRSLRSLHNKRGDQTRPDDGKNFFLGCLTVDVATAAGRVRTDLFFS